MLYVDTSVLVAALTNESRTAEMQDWLASQRSDDLVISDWVMTEFSAALSIKVRTHQIAPGHRAEALALFKEMSEHSLGVVAVSRLDFAAATRFADQYATGLRAGDALHLAIAANHGYRLVSLDRGLSDAALALGVSFQLF
ncbi:MAG: type II toxin-antitoxin system VapC family toxin [Sedimenticolaceae bacterium]